MSDIVEVMAEALARSIVSEWEPSERGYESVDAVVASRWREWIPYVQTQLSALEAEGWVVVRQADGCETSFTTGPVPTSGIPMGEWPGVWTITTHDRTVVDITASEPSPIAAPAVRRPEGPKPAHGIVHPQDPYEGEKK